MSLRRDLLGGLVVVAPILLVLYVILLIFNNLSSLPVPFYTPTGTPTIDTAIRVIFISLAMAIALILVGRGTRTFIGKEAEHWFDRQMNRVPALRVVYNASKVALEMAISGTQEYQMPVIVDIHEQLSLVGFKTGTEVMNGRETVFIPTSPNITSGMIVYVEPERLRDVDESTEQVLTHVLSAGFLKPGEAETDEVESLLGYLKGS